MNDSGKFILALIVSLILAGGVVYSSHQRRTRTGGASVDLVRVEKLSEEGVISLHGASFWSPVLEGGR